MMADSCRVAGMIPELFRGVGGSVVVVMYERIKYIYGI